MYDFLSQGIIFWVLLYFGGRAEKIKRQRKEKRYCQIFPSSVLNNQGEWPKINIGELPKKMTSTHRSSTTEKESSSSVVCKATKYT
jgi:hypothetical protein